MAKTTAVYVECPFHYRNEEYNPCKMPCYPCHICKAPPHFIKADETCPGCIRCMNAHKPHMSESDADSGAACNG
jgi:hypothetical protein